MSLAIIIPAYKNKFLDQTLSSLNNQTCKNFSVYIGDDKSCEDLYPTIKKYENTLNIYYERFNENIGSVSLVQQWKRCINLSKDERWIMLFSDDDILSIDCIEKFYEIINPDSKLYKYNSKIIDSKGRRIKYKEGINRFRSQLSTEEFINLRLMNKGYRSYVVEYIFSRDLYNNCDIIDLPLAWCSDDLMWIQYSVQNNYKITGINTDVFWRYSGENISSNILDENIKNKKVIACVSFLKFLNEISLKNSININKFRIINWFIRQMSYYSLNSNFNNFKSNIEKCFSGFSKYNLYFQYLKFLCLRTIRKMINLTKLVVFKINNL